MATSDDDRAAMLAAAEQANAWDDVERGWFEAGWNAARAEADRGTAQEVERLRKALEEVHRYGLNVAGCAEAYGEQESAHLWNEIAAIAEAALWPIAALSGGSAAPEGGG